MMFALSAVVFGLACAEPGSIEVDPVSDTDNPFEVGASYAGCQDGTDCESDWCLRPADEPGFCTEPCSLGDASSCEKPAHGGAPAVCVAVSGDAACALDCSAAECPSGMRCEAVDVGGEPRSLCF
ncbi:hypothetical protein PPSIR1_27248 [Plesiocystis pacifica SIR-1]|uniref:Uncharacterized protein n=2 Tax=Plesiocystis pacifica TaxID=191768 RepID=A6G4L4_9BACT|nr:hypothetical protein PPSIR1_27248 [Plesiocystis pacifica SIR-1]